MNTKKSQAPDIGAPFEGGFFGGQIRIGGAILAVIWAPKALGEASGVWLPDSSMVADALSCCDSMGNTQAMAEAGSPLAKWALGLEINGHADWCIPARDVLELGYRHLKPTNRETYCGFRDGDNPSSLPPGYPYTKEGAIAQTTVDAFQAGNSESFEANWYWSSTVYSEASAWFQGFSTGFQFRDHQLNELRARAVRLIQLNA